LIWASPHAIARIAPANSKKTKLPLVTGIGEVAVIFDLKFTENKGQHDLIEIVK